MLNKLKSREIINSCETSYTYFLTAIKWMACQLCLLFSIIFGIYIISTFYWRPIVIVTAKMSPNPPPQPHKRFCLSLFLLLYAKRVIYWGLGGCCYTQYYDSTVNTAFSYNCTPWSCDYYYYWRADRNVLRRQGWSNELKTQNTSSRQIFS